MILQFSIPQSRDSWIHEDPLRVLIASRSFWSAMIESSQPSICLDLHYDLTITFVLPLISAARSAENRCHGQAAAGRRRVRSGLRRDRLLQLVRQEARQVLQILLRQGDAAGEGQWPPPRAADRGAATWLAIVSGLHGDRLGRQRAGIVAGPAGAGQDGPPHPG